jgi:PPOX class probable F420-dependent enzyme
VFRGRYLSITSFRRDGTGVVTPVWFVSDGTRLFALTDLHSAKIRRIRRNPRVLVAPCRVDGKLRGEPIAASAEVRTAIAELERVQKLLLARYKISYRVVMVFYRLGRRLRGQRSVADGAALAITLEKRRRGIQMSTVSSSPTEKQVVHVSGPRPTPRQLAHELRDVAVAVPLFSTAPLLRHWHRRWGATDAEVAAAMPGDELVRDCRYRCTHAITIDVPPRAVWPWLVQVGFGKAGFYSNDLLDNVAHPSADRIVEEFQHPRVGDWVPMFSKVNDTTAFKIAALTPPEALVWVKPDSTWAWTLTDVGGSTRLVTRLRNLYRWHRPADALLSLVLNEFGDFPMMRKMLLTLKQRAEADPAAEG